MKVDVADRHWGRRVLIVDDEEDLVFILADTLESRGYQVESAYSTRGAMEKIEGYDAQVALLDIRLGYDSGIDLLAKLKQVHPEILCVMMTAYATMDSAVEAIHRGAYDYLQKPLDVQADRVSGFFPFSVTKNSKYVTGIERVYL